VLRRVLACALLTSLLLPRGAAGRASSSADEAERAFQRGDYAAAVALAERRLQARPDDVEAQVVRARAEAARGRFDSAFEGFQRALRTSPRHEDALYYLGITAGVLAQAEYERLFAIAPDSARAHQLLAESLQAQDKPEEAQRELQLALEKSPRSIEVLVALGDLERKRLRFAEAQSHYESARALAPGRYDVLYGLGVCHSFRGQQAQAVSLFRAALRQDPGSAPARLALGIALLQTAQPAEAARELEAAVKAEPGMRQGHYQLGRAYQALGRTEDAEAAFARAQRILEQQRALDAGPAEPDPR
jgi:Tfp pilus assembly protein PilF